MNQPDLRNVAMIPSSLQNTVVRQVEIIWRETLNG